MRSTEGNSFREVWSYGVMSTVGRSLVVRRRDIERDPRPEGGGFERLAILPVLPRFLARAFGVFCVNTADRMLALTFDDGPHPEDTPRILDALAEHGARATFFVLAAEARRHRDIVRRIVAEGHEVALHGEDHRSLLTMSTRLALSSIRDARHAVEDLSGTPVTLFRPPYGEFTFAQAIGIRGMGLDIVIWSADALDWLHDEESAIADRALATVFPGSILLLHDNRADPETLAPGEVLPAFDRQSVSRLILRSLEAEGYRAVTAGELLSQFQQVRSAAKGRMTAPR